MTTARSVRPTEKSFLFYNWLFWSELRRSLPLCKCSWFSWLNRNSLFQVGQIINSFYLTFSSFCWWWASSRKWSINQWFKITLWGCKNLVNRKFKRKLEVKLEMSIFKTLGMLLADYNLFLLCPSGWWILMLAKRMKKKITAGVFSKIIFQCINKGYNCKFVVLFYFQRSLF